MHVAESGPLTGTPIVFLHGSMVAGWMWTSQVEGLAEYRCLVPDLPGLGHSGDEDWLSFADTADRVADLIRSRNTDGSAHVVGLSLGGVVGLHLGANHPDVVRSLLVSGVPSGPINRSLRALNKVMLFLYSRPWGARLIGRMFGMPDDDSMTAFVQTAAQTNDAALKRIADEVSTAPLPANLGSAATPTLAVVGTKDTKPALRTPALLSESMPNASSYLVPDVGHQWNAEKPELFTNMVRAWIPERRIEQHLSPADH